jgi:hypothetical protein
VKICNNETVPTVYTPKEKNKSVSLENLWKLREEEEEEHVRFTK